MLERLLISLQSLVPVCPWYTVGQTKHLPSQTQMCIDSKRKSTTATSTSVDALSNVHNQAQIMLELARNNVQKEGARMFELVKTKSRSREKIMHHLDQLRKATTTHLSTMGNPVPVTTSAIHGADWQEEAHTEQHGSYSNAPGYPGLIPGLGPGPGPLPHTSPESMYQSPYPWLYNAYTAPPAAGPGAGVVIAPHRSQKDADHVDNVVASNQFIIDQMSRQMADTMKCLNELTNEKRVSSIILVDLSKCLILLMITQL